MIGLAYQFVISPSFAQVNSTALSSSTEKQEQIAKQFAQAIAEQDRDKLIELIDFDALFLPAAKSVATKRSYIRGFLKGLKSTGAPNVVKSIIQSVHVSNGELKYKRIIEQDGELRPFLRMDIPEGGHDFILLTLNPRSYKITDLYFASAGRLMSEQFKETVGLMIAPSKGVFSEIFSSIDIDEKIVDILKQIVQLNNRGLSQQSYQLINSLPDEVRYSRPIMHTAMQIAQQVSESAYKTELDNLAKHHGDEESLQFMLIDHHFYREDYPAAKKGITSLLKQFGEDAAVYNLLASLYFVSDEPTQAIESANKAIALEPDFEEAHWVLVSVLTTDKQYSKLIEALDILQERFAYSFQRANFESDAFYSDFVSSKEFEQWIGD